MSLEVVGAGMGRTGTLSLKRALEILGFGRCYHPLDSGLEEIERVHRALNLDPPDWGEAFRGYRAAVDWPAYVIYKELARRHSTAKVILTVREPTEYAKSFLALARELEHYPPGPEEREFARKMALARSRPARDVLSQDVVLTAFHEHNAEVRSTIPSERMLSFDVKEGWQPLCEFLGVPIPSVSFPRSNSRGELPSLLNRLWRGQGQGLDGPRSGPRPPAPGGENQGQG